MELSRRGVLGGLGAACAVGAVGFAGAASVTDDASDGENTVGGSGGSDDDGGDGDAGSVEVDPDAPFQAHLLGGDSTDGNDEDLRLFDASDLGRVEGVFAENDEYLVYVALGDAGIETFQERLAESGATDSPADFVVSMTLDETEVRRVELDEPTVAALTDDEWGGVLTLPFDEESVAESVYESLAAT